MNILQYKTDKINKKICKFKTVYIYYMRNNISYVLFRAKIEPPFHFLLKKASKVSFGSLDFTDKISITQ